MEQARTFFHKVFSIIKRPEMRILPGQLAFFFVLSLVPLIALVGTIAASFNISVSSLEEAMKVALPVDISNTLLTYVSGKGLNFNIIIFFYLNNIYESVFNNISLFISYFITNMKSLFISHLFLF